MKKRNGINSILYLLSFLLVFTMPISAFALEAPPEAEIIEQTTEETADDVSETVADVVGNQDVVDDFIEMSDEYVADSDTVTITMPKDESDSVVISTEYGEDFSIRLPEVVDMEGALSDSGTVVYDSSEENVQVALQVISDSEVFEDSYALRAMITIDDFNAPHEYEFPFDLPQGYTLIHDYDFDAAKEEDSIGAIYVVDENNEIVNVIEPAWAVDANQETIPTHYEIRGNTLVQVVDFDVSSAFPIVADPTSHPNITRAVTLSRSQILKIRNQYTGSTALKVVNGIFFIVGFTKLSTLNSAWSLIAISGSYYYQKNYSTWDKIYTQMGSTNYARITFTYRWVGGHSRSDYIPTGNVKCEYIRK